MRHTVLLQFLLFGIFADANAYCDAQSKYGSNLDYSLNTSLQMTPGVLDMLHQRCHEQSALGRQIELREHNRSVELEFVNVHEHNNQHPLAALPLENGKLSLKIAGDGYTIRFRRKAVIITWKF